MAPTPYSDEIVDLSLSSLELDSRSTTSETSITANTLLKRDGVPYSPSEVYHILTARDDAPVSTKTSSLGGAIDPNAINMKGVQALFALIGASFVLGAIWFFFWAKNGGFKWQKGDWDEYKSTVLRRKGPNGTTLSNATKSTRLGGGSVVGEGYSDAGGSTVTGTMTETMTELSSEAPIMKEKQDKSKRSSRVKESAKDRKIREAKQAGWEGGHDDDLRAYINERPAKVGGINKDSEALHYGTHYTDTTPSVNSQRPSRHQQQEQQSSSRQHSPEKRQSRRDFSYGNDAGFSTVSSSSYPDQQQQQPNQYYSQQQTQQPPTVPPHRPGRYHSPSKQSNPNSADPRRANGNINRGVPGAYHESSDLSDAQSQGTKSYHHPLPGLSGNGNANNNNQQGRGGFRRDRRDSLDD